MSKFSINEQLTQDSTDSTRTLHAGIDLALEKNVVVVINANGERLDYFSFPQDRGGYDYFQRRMKSISLKQQASGWVVAMEPSNYFWKLIASELEEKGVTYHLVNPYTVKKHREGDQLDRSKDDRRDAVQIAELSRNGHYTKTHLQKGKYAELRQYACLYDQTTQAIHREKQVLWGLVGQVFPELFHIFKKLDGETSRALLMSCACAATICQMTQEEFITGTRSMYTGKKLAISRVRSAYQMAATSIGITEGLPAIQLAIRMHLSQLQAFQNQLKQVTDAMTACFVTLPEASYILSIKSLSAISAALFLAEVGDPSRYQAAAQWVKLAGIQPTPNNSGKKQRNRTPMSRQGRPHLRTMLYYTCLRMVQHDPHFAQLYFDFQRRPKNPLTKMQALGALMNKLLHLLWALIHNQTFYNSSFAQSI
ncbi:MAG: transposase family protein [Chloroflexi bacterium]|nr:MAG: transposase family protein [Chloroflexota bacterium]